MRLFVSFILAFAFITGSYFQGKHEDPGETINWSPTTKLTWNDFKKSLKGKSIEAAYSVSGINMQPKQLDNSTVMVNVQAFFSKTLSAKTIEKDHLTDEVLSHEQGHFDITEWYARILRKDISEAKYKNIAQFYKNLQSLYYKVNSDCNKEQLEYDKETNHSINLKEQEKWSGIIAKGLEKYEAYTNSQLKITIK